MIARKRHPNVQSDVHLKIKQTDTNDFYTDRKLSRISSSFIWTTTNGLVYARKGSRRTKPMHVVHAPLLIFERNLWRGAKSQELIIRRINQRLTAGIRNFQDATIRNAVFRLFRRCWRTFWFTPSITLTSVLKRSRKKI